MSDLRTEAAEGLAKLIYNGRISSAKIFSRLVLLWYNPVTEDDTRLRHCLGVFFQLYARESRCVCVFRLSGWVGSCDGREQAEPISVLSGFTRKWWRRVSCRPCGR